MEEGQSIIEYMLILLLMAIIVIVILTILGDQISEMYSLVEGMFK